MYEITKFAFLNIPLEFVVQYLKSIISCLFLLIDTTPPKYVLKDNAKTLYEVS